MLFDSIFERNKFVEKNLPLVISRVKKRNNGAYDDDLFQEGAKALIEATDRFDSTKENNFSTYAVSYIDNYILKYKTFDSIIKPKRKGRKWKFEYKDVISLDKETEDENSFVKNICKCNNPEQSVVDEIVVSDFLSSLSRRNRTIIDLLLTGLNHEEISKIIGTHRTYVCKLINGEGKKYLNNFLI